MAKVLASVKRGWPQILIGAVVFTISQNVPLDRSWVEVACAAAMMLGLAAGWE